MARKHLKSILKSTLLILLLYFIGRVFIQQIRLIKWESLDINSIFLCTAFLSDITARICSGILYGSLLRRFNAYVPYRISMSVSWLSLLGKYIPGKIAILGSAIYLLSKYHVKPEIAGIVPILANGMVAVVCFFFSLPLFFSSQKNLFEPFLQAWFYLLPLIGIALIFSKSWLRLINWAFRFINKPSIIYPKLSLKLMLYPFLIVLFQCLFTGITTWWLMRALTFISVTAIPIVISISILAGTLGFLTFFAPAGLGIREGIYLYFLTSLIGSELAVLTAICLRLIHTINDILLGGAGLTLLHFTPYAKEIKNAE